MNDNIFNLLDVNFGTLVTSSAVTADGYEEQNLLSHGLVSRGKLFYHHSRQGYRAEHFIKPPVDVVFTFPCYVDIESIVFQPHGGTFRILTFELMTATSPVTSAETQTKFSSRDQTLSSLSRHPGSAIGHTRRRKRQGRQLPYYNPLLNKHQTPTVPTTISKCFPMKYSLNVEPKALSEEASRFSKLAFFNSRDASRRKVVFSCQTCGNGNAIDDTDVLNLKFTSCQGLSHLILRIKRMANSCVVGFGGMEIWGKVSKKCSQLVVGHVSDIFHKAYELPYSFVSTHTTPETISVKCGTEKVDGSKNGTLDGRQQDICGWLPSGVQLPEEFLDAITCNRMVLPMLLPSGHSIDMTTLERCVEESKRWGRGPVDPFTGLPFTDTRKPIPNVSLKTRIDQFTLTEDGSKLLSNNQLLGGTVNESKGTLYNFFQSNTRSIKDRIKVSLTGCRKNSKEQSVRQKNVTETLNPSYSLPKPVNVDKEEEKQKDHEIELAASLNQSLTKSLSFLAKLKQRTSEWKDPDSSIPTCAVCSLNSRNIILYKMMCVHFLCRSCVFKVSFPHVCKICNQICSKQDLERYFDKSRYFLPH